MNVASGYNYHEFSTETVPVCRFYLLGRCKFGNYCINRHEQTVVASSSITDKSFSNDSSSSSTEDYFLNSCKATNLLDEFGPITSSSLEAIALVRRAQSQEKSCGICFDVIVDKAEPTEQVFGILPNCNHCYCFSCIRKWRQTKEFQLDVAKTCPQCRISSDYVYRSRHWIVEKDEKESFIAEEKSRMKTIHCRYFKKGVGKCRFGNACLYLHALPAGINFKVEPSSDDEGSAVEDDMSSETQFSNDGFHVIGTEVADRLIWYQTNGVNRNNSSEAQCTLL